MYRSIAESIMVSSNFITPGHGSIDANDIIDFMVEYNQSISTREDENLRIGIADFFGDGDKILCIFVCGPDFTAENQVYLRIGKRITKSRREAILKFISDYIEGAIEFDRTYSLA